MLAITCTLSLLSAILFLSFGFMRSLTYGLCEGGAAKKEDEGGADVHRETDHGDQVGRHP